MFDDILKELKDDIDKKFLDYRLAGTGIMTVVFTISAGVLGSFAVTEKVSGRLALCLSTFAFPMLTSLYQQYLHYFAGKFFADGLFHRYVFFAKFTRSKQTTNPNGFEFIPDGTTKSSELFTLTEKWFVRSLNFFIASIVIGGLAVSVDKKWPTLLDSLCLGYLILGVAISFLCIFFLSEKIFIHRSLGKVTVNIRYADGTTKNEQVG